MKRNKKKLIIAIDGPAGSGKSTTTQELARRLKVPYIDTGAMYRAVTLKAMQEKIPFSNQKDLVAAAKRSRIDLKEVGGKQKVLLDGKDVTKKIRTTQLTKNVFYVAQIPQIRKEMVKKQRALGLKNGAAMEGRDIGTKVFPDADFKFYFEASPEVRAKRRYRELVQKGEKMTLKQVYQDIIRRDKTDYDRKEGPLKQAKDAILVDTSGLTIGQTADKLLAIIRSQHGS